MIIFLVGLPGAGKTFWSKKLAHKYDFKTIDLDEEIVRQTGKSIPEIFAEGELVFRQLENQYLTLLIEQNHAENIIIATGGGAPAHLNNMELMLANGKCVYLRGDAAFIASRIINSKTERPLVKSLDIQQLVAKITQMLTERGSFYEKAHEIIEVKNAKIVNFDHIFKYSADATK